MADCSAVLGFWGLAPNSLRGLRPLRSNSRAKSVDEACCARGPKALCSSTPPTGPTSNAVVASQLPHHTSLRTGRERSKRHLADAKRAESGVHLPLRPSRQGSLLCLLSCRYKFAKRGSAHFANQSYADTKGGRPPGRNPGAASRSEQEIRESSAGLRYLSPNGWWYANKASTGSARTEFDERSLTTEFDVKAAAAPPRGLRAAQAGRPEESGTPART